MAKSSQPKSSQPKTESVPPLAAADVGPGFTATFLYYFTSATLLATLVATKGLNLSLASGLPQQLGLVVGLAAGAAGGYFNRTVALSIAAPNTARTRAKVEAALSDMGYSLDAPNPAISEPATGEASSPLSVYVRSPLRRLLSGRIYIQQDGNQLTMASRAGHMRQLQRRLSELS